MRDQIFSQAHDLVDFTFDANVANVFDDMVRRSVPGYQSMIELVGLCVKTYGQDNTNYYDLGASTGATSMALSLNDTHQNTQIIAVDNSPSMVSKCSKKLAGKVGNVQVVCADVETLDIQNASLVVLNLTLQFIAPKNRQALINKIYRGLNPGGALIISEKIHFDDSQQQQLMTKLHLDFKRANGYSELEIAAKRQSIENVLITDSQETHFNRMHLAGFHTYTCHFQCLNFACFLAVK